LIDRMRAIRGALALRSLDLSGDDLDEQSFADWLRAHGQNAATIQAMWDLITVATLNAPAEQASLALAAMVFQVGLLTHADAGDVGWSKVPLQQLHGDAGAKSLAAAGAEVRLNAKIEELIAREGGWTLRERNASDTDFDQVVLAVPPPVAERLLPAGALTMAPGWAQRLGSSPIVNVHIVFDRPVLDEPFLAGVDTPVQWIFDRTIQSGIADGQYVAISLSAATDTIELTTAQIREWILPAVVELIPAARSAQVRDFFVTRERHATFTPAPGSARSRPAAATLVPGLALAGAWTATGWPATMESAVLSGHAAAEQLGQYPVGEQWKGSFAA
jgi:squalene-associated FAD-dependent desaturase